MNSNTFRTLRVSGLIGLAVQATINLAVLALGKTKLFSDQWWSDFFPGYVVWSVFAIVGFLGTRGDSANQK
jgi:hypothetical protein